MAAQSPLTFNTKPMQAARRRRPFSKASQLEMQFNAATWAEGMTIENALGKHCNFFFFKKKRDVTERLKLLLRQEGKKQV